MRAELMTSGVSVMRKIRQVLPFTLLLTGFISSSQGAVSITSCPVPIEVGQPIAPGSSCVASGAVGAVTWSITNANAGPGFAITSAGVLSGSTTDAALNFSVTADDGTTHDTKVFNAALISAPTISAGCLPSRPFEVGVTYSSACTATGGTPAGYSWTISGSPGSAGTVFPTTASGSMLNYNGTPSVAGQTGTVTISLQDGVSSIVATKTLIYTAVAPALSISCPNVSGPREVGLPFTSQCTANGTGVGPLTWSVLAAPNPAAAAVNSTGLVSATPTATTVNFTVNAHDSLGVDSTQVFSPSTVFSALSGSCSPGTGALEQGATASPYSVTCTVTGGAPPYNWSVSSGTVPAGLVPNFTTSSNSPVQVLAGTFTNAGGGPFTLQVRDSLMAISSVAQSLGGVVAARPAFTCTPVPANVTLEVGEAYEFDCSVSPAGTPPYTWSVPGKPAWLNITSVSGAAPLVLQGTPQSSDGGVPVSFTVSMNDAAGSAATATNAMVSATVTRKPAINSCVPPTNLEVGALITSAASICSAVAGTGTAPLTWTATGLPGGVTMTPAGALSGTPTAPGSFPVTVTLTDSAQPTNQQSTTVTFSLNVATALNSPVCVPVGTPEVNVSYSVACSVQGGVGPYTWMLNSGPVSPGLAIAAGDGSSAVQVVVNGTFTTAGSFPFTLKVKDGATSPVTAVDSADLLGGTVVPPPTLQCQPSVGGVLTLPDHMGVPYSSVCTVVNGTQPGTPTGFVFSIVDNTVGHAAASLPPGLFKSQNGPRAFSIFGTPSTFGTLYNFGVLVADGAIGANGQPQPQMAFQDYSVTPVQGLHVSCSPSLGPTEYGIPYSATCTAAGGTPPYTWVQLPVATGLTISPTTGATATVSSNAGGTSFPVGQYSFTVQASDSSAAVQTATQTFGPGTTLAAPTVTCDKTTGPTEVNLPYTTTCRVSGGQMPYTWNAGSGSVLPPGLTISGSGSSITINYTPAAGAANRTFNYTVQVSDTGVDAGGTSRPQSGLSGSFAGTVQPTPGYTCSPAGTAGPTEVNVNFAVTCTASGGTKIYSWALTGALPAGLVMSTATNTNSNDTVTISGAPTSATASYTFGLKLTDSASIAAPPPDTTFTGAILPAPVATCDVTAGPIETGIPYRAICSIPPGSGTGPFTWRIPTTGVPVPAPPAGLTTANLTVTADGRTATLNFTPTAPIDPGANPVGFSYPIQLTDSAKDNSGANANQSSSVSFSGQVSSRPLLTCVDNLTASQATNTKMTSGGYPLGTQYVGATQVGVYYTNTCNVTGGIGPFAWAIKDRTGNSGSNLLPAGIELKTVDDAATINGSPTMKNTSYDYAVEVIDNLNNSVVSSTLPKLALEYKGAILATLTVNCTLTPTLEIGESRAGPSVCSIDGGTKPYKVTLTDAPGLNPSLAPACNFSAGAMGCSIDVSTYSFLAGSSPPLQLGCYLYGAEPTSLRFTSVNVPGGSGSIVQAVNFSLSASAASAGYCSAGPATSPTVAFPFTTNQTSVAVVFSPTQTSGGSPFAPTLTITDSAPTTVTQSTQLSVTVNDTLRMICTNPTAPVQVGVPYFNSCSTVGGVGGVAWSLVNVGDNIPSGLQFVPNGSTATIAGTPLVAGENFGYTIRATDINGVRAFSLVYRGAIRSAVSIGCSSSLGPAEAGVPFNAVTCSGTGGTTPYTFALSGNYPATTQLTPDSKGLQAVLSSSPNQLSPPADAPYNFTVTISDAVGETAAQSFTGTVVQLPTIQCTNSSGPLQIGEQYLSVCTAFHGTPPYTWLIASGALPHGLTGQTSADNRTFTIAGRPDSEISGYRYGVQVQDSLKGASLVSTFAGNVLPVLRLTTKYTTTTPSGVLTLHDNGVNTLTVSVANAATTPFAGKATILMTLDSGLVVQGLPSGAGWDCSASGSSTISCVRSDNLVLAPAGGSNSAFADVTAIFTVADEACGGPVGYSAGVLVGGFPYDTKAQTALKIAGCLQITKSHIQSFTPQSADGTVNGSGTYTLTVSNASTATLPASVIQIADVLASPLMIDATALQGQSQGNWKCSATGNNTAISCTLSGSGYQPGQIDSVITLPVVVTSPNCSYVTDAATVSLSEATLGAVLQSVSADPTSINGIGCITLSGSYTPPVGSAVSGLSKTSSPPKTTKAQPRDSNANAVAGIYNIMVSNTSEGDFSDTTATVQVALPADFAATQVADGNWTCDTTTNPVPCRLSPQTVIQSGQSMPLRLTVIPPPSAPCGVFMGSLSLQIQNATQGQAYDVPFGIPGPSCLTVTRTYPSQVSVDDRDGNYTLIISNPGGQDIASDVNVREVLPTGLAPTSVSGDNWTCSITGQAISCSRGDAVAAGASYEPIKVVYNVLATACPGITGTTYVSSNRIDNGVTVDNLPLSGCFQPSIQAPLSFPIGGADPNAGVGTYVLKATYRGTAPDFGVVNVSDTLPIGFTPVASDIINASSPGWTCTTTPPSDIGQSWSISCSRRAPGTFSAIQIPIASVDLGACPAGNLNQFNQLSAVLNLLNGTSVPGPISVRALATPSGTDQCPAGTLSLSTVSGATSLTPFAGTTYRLTATTGANGLPENSIVQITDVFNSGVVPDISGVSGPWTCTLTGSAVTCTLTTTAALGPNVPLETLVLGVTVDSRACPSADDSATVSLGSVGLPGRQIILLKQLNSVPMQGCLSVSQPTLSFNRIPLGKASASQSLLITANDAAPLTVKIAPDHPELYTATSGDCPDLAACVLKPRQSIQVNVVFSPQCIGSGSIQAGTLNITPVVKGAKANPVSLTGSAILPGPFSYTGISPLQSFSDPVMLDVGLASSAFASLPAGSFCTAGAKANVTASLQRASFVWTGDASTTDQFYDIALGKCSASAAQSCLASLSTGTVAGTLALQTVFMNGTTPVSYPDDTTITVTVPPVKPVLTSMAKGDSSTSSLQINVAGYSTPRGANKANEQVCFKFSAAPGTILDAGQLNSCLATDISTWYERVSSYPTGSKFSTNFTFSYSGDIAAIGTVETYLRNSYGDSAKHLCLDFKAGTVKDGSCTQ